MINRKNCEAKGTRFGKCSVHTAEAGRHIWREQEGRLDNHAMKRLLRSLSAVSAEARKTGCQSGSETQKQDKIREGIGLLGSSGMGQAVRRPHVLHVLRRGSDPGACRLAHRMEEQRGGQGLSRPGHPAPTRRKAEHKKGASPTLCLVGFTSLGFRLAWDPSPLPFRFVPLE